MLALPILAPQGLYSNRTWAAAPEHSISKVDDLQHLSLKYMCLMPEILLDTCNVIWLYKYNNHLWVFTWIDLWHYNYPKCLLLLLNCMVNSGNSPLVSDDEQTMLVIIPIGLYFWSALQGTVTMHLDNKDKFWIFGCRWRILGAKHNSCGLPTGWCIKYSVSHV